LQLAGGVMSVTVQADVTFNGNSNVMTLNCVDSSKCKSGAKNIYSFSKKLKFSVCKPGTTNIPGTYNGWTRISNNLEKCSVELCAWSDITRDAIDTGTYLVPATGCKMKRWIKVLVDVTINGNSGSLSELQSNQVDNQGIINGNSRHFWLEQGKLTLNSLKLTWGEVGLSNMGGFIFMKDGTLHINSVLFDGSQLSLQRHAKYGGAIRVNNGQVEIKDSTFVGFKAEYGGAIYVFGTSTPMTIESTTFKNNDATVRFIFAELINYIFLVLFIFCNK
jgi:hypothetical protein